jgi:type II secretion system protein D
MSLALSLASAFPIYGQEASPAVYRTYVLQHRPATEVVGQVQEMFAGIASRPQVGVDRERNQLIVHGNEEAQKLAQQLVTVLDEQPADSSRRSAAGAQENTAAQRTSTVELQSYVYLGDLEAVAGQLRQRYGQLGQVEIATDKDTGRLIVAAPRPIQQLIASELAELDPQRAAVASPAAGGPALSRTRHSGRSVSGGEAREDGPRGGAPTGSPVRSRERSPAGSTTAANSGGERLTSLALQHLSAQQFEQRLQALLPQALYFSRGASGETTVVSLVTADGTKPIMLIDRRESRVLFEGEAAATAPWRRLMKAVDVAHDTEQRTELVQLSNANPTQLQDAVAQLNHAMRQGAGGVVLGGEGNRALGEPRWGGDLLAKIFLQEGQPMNPAPPPAPPAPAAPANNTPATNAAAGTPPTTPEAASSPTVGGTTNGFLGPVQIEYIEGLDVIVLRGRKQDVERLQKIIAEIEQLSATTQPTIEIHQLKHVNDEAVVTLITELYEQILASRQGQVSIRALVNPNAILLIGRQENLTFIKQLIERLDQPADPLSEFVILRLKYASAVQAEQTIRNFFVNQPGSDTQPIAGLGVRPKVVADYRTNALIVRASPRDLEQIKRLVDNLDVETGQTSFEIRVFRLRNALAADLAETLLGAIRGQSGTGGQTQQAPGAIPGGGGGAGQTQSSALQPSAALQFRTIDQQTGAILKSGIMDDVQVTADANINALIVRAPSESMELMQALIQELDQIPDAEAVIKVFTVVNGDATNLTAVLQQLFGQQVTAGQGNAQFPFAFGQGAQAQAASTGEGSLVPLTFAVDVRTNSIIASGSPTDLTVVETLLLRLDESDIATRKLTVVRLKNAPALDVANSITTFLTSQRQLIQQQLLFNQAISPFEQIEREVIVVPEVVTNSLIVSATPRYYEEVLQVIKDLDFRPAMVMVQVIIAEVAVGNGFEFGTELGLQSSLLFDRGVAATNPANQLTPGFNFIDGDPGLPNLSDVRSSTIGGQGISTLGLGRASNLTNVSYGGLVLSAASDSVAGLIRALEQQDRLQVIARPQIMALNNQEAFVQVGADVARITGTTTTNAGFQQNVEDVATGLILRVQPLINDDGVVVMNIDAERSRLGPTSEGTVIGSIETNTGVQPLIIQPIERTTAQTTISAKSGQTVVFAGLITDSKRAEQRGIPWLSKIPVLGRLFRYDAFESERTELLIVMTPHIIDDDEDYEVVKLFESQRMTWCLSDVIEIHGDVGLAGGPCLFCEDGVPTLYPDLDPTAASLHRLQHQAPPAETAPASLPGYPPQGMEGPTMMPEPPAGAAIGPRPAPHQSMAEHGGFPPPPVPGFDGPAPSSRRQAPAPLMPMPGPEEPAWRKGSPLPDQAQGGLPAPAGLRPLPAPHGQSAGPPSPVLPAGYAPSPAPTTNPVVNSTLRN